MLQLLRLSLLQLLKLQLRQLLQVHQPLKALKVLQRPPIQGQ